MKWLGLLLSVQVWAAGPIDVFLDLDWTLYNKVTPESLAQFPEGVILVHGEHYRLMPGAIELAEALHKNPRFRPNIYSGGASDRNEILVSHLYQALNAKQNTPEQWKPFRVGNVEQMVEVNPKAPRFRDRKKKDLLWINRTLGPGENPVDLTRAVLVDDVPGFTYRDQPEFWIGATYDDIPDYDLWRKTIDRWKLEAPPPSYQEWFLDRHRLTWVREVLLEAANNFEKNGRTYMAELNIQAHK